MNAPQSPVDAPVDAPVTPTQFLPSFLNVPMSDAATKMVQTIKKRLEMLDASKTAYAVMFVGSLAFIAQGVYALITIGLAVMVAAWSLKKLFDT